MNPFLIIAAELDSDENQTVGQEKQKQKAVFAANDDRYSTTCYGSKAANE